MKRERRAVRLRQAIEELGRKKQTPFPRNLKRRISDYARARRRDGAAFKVIEAETGVDCRTLALWVPKSGRRAGRFERVEIAPAETPRVVIEHRSGCRIEGLDVAGLADLLRRLS